MRRLSYAVATVTALLCSSVQSTETKGRLWSVGYSETDITPAPNQALMAGFGRERYAQGTLLPLRAQALAVQDGDGTTVLLITADVLGFGRVSVDAIRHRISAAHALPPAAVCLAASHTHWGPAVNYRTNFAIGGLNVWYLRRLEEGLLKLANDAISNLAPASISYGACETQIGMCRRRPNAQGEIGWGPYPEGSYDKHTPVVHIQRDSTPKQIVLVGHACHPTSSGPVEQWSAGYPGSMRRRLEARLDDCRALFVMGCGADAKVVYQDAQSGEYAFAGSPDQSRVAGVKLADEVLAYLAAGKTHALKGTLNARLVRGQLSFAQPRSRAEVEKMAFDGDPRSYATWWARQSLAYPDTRQKQNCEVQTWQLGSLTMVVLEGEVCADWGSITRALVPTEHAMVIAYANHVFGYVPTARIVREGGYEGDTSHMAYFLPAPFDPKVETELKQLIGEAVTGGQAASASEHR